MTRMFETSEITKLLDVLIGKTEAVGETNEDERRLDNLKTLIDITNWCLDGLQFAMASGYGRAERSMAEISYTAQCALDEYGRWISDVLEEQKAEQTEPQTEYEKYLDKIRPHDPHKDWCGDEPQTERTCTNCKHNGVISVPKCDECHDMNKHEFIEPQTDCGWR